jgi:flagellar protein FlgJ
MDTKLADASNFLDINGLNNIRHQSNQDNKEDKEAALQSAAKQFEAIFMQMLLKSMRSAQEVLESDSPFNSQSTKFYRDMHDQQLSLELSDNGSLGLSDLIVRQLGGDSDKFTPHTILRSDGKLSSRPTSTQVDVNSPTNIPAFQLNKNDGQLNHYDDPTLEMPLAPSALDTQKPSRFEVPEPAYQQPKDFVTALVEPAKKVQEQLNVPFAVVIAQAALETGWGKKIIKTENGNSSNNLFNIKADGRWQGDKTHKETLEFEQGAMVKKKEPFRVYESVKESIDDYVSFLSSGSRYQGALEKASDVEHFLQGLQRAGYATDPQYAEKIMGTLRKVTTLLAE